MYCWRDNTEYYCMIIILVTVLFLLHTCSVTVGYALFPFLFSLLISLNCFWRVLYSLFNHKLFCRSSIPEKLSLMKHLNSTVLKIILRQNILYTYRKLIVYLAENTTNELKSYLFLAIKLAFGITAFATLLDAISRGRQRKCLEKAG